jgi:hypothetical protein
MKTRVTITLDPAVHAHAKRAARMRHTTVSGLIEAYLRSTATASTGSLVDDMLGSATLRRRKRGRDPLYDALRERHIARRR